MPNTPLPSLATAVDLAERLQLTTPTGTVLTAWNDALLDASSAVRDAIGQPITLGTATFPIAINEYGFGLIPVSPVIAVTGITDPAGIVLPTDGTAFQAYGQRLNIYSRYMTANPNAPLDPIYLVTVSHGWDPIPGEILRWVYTLAAAQIANAAGGSLGVNGGPTSVAIDDGKVTYSDRSGMIPDRAQARLRAMYGGEQ